ncbi:hypothetical protein XENOCAPTIV_009609 [Xenoophorus captivus]|uniref:Uncharacterized protein n=1 Tax=Xenoophorus captivus TaxID=1517983 RepID=A0ABV0QIN0_9TELE
MYPTFHPLTTGDNHKPHSTHPPASTQISWLVRSLELCCSLVNPHTRISSMWLTTPSRPAVTSVTIIFWKCSGVLVKVVSTKWRNERGENGRQFKLEKMITSICRSSKALWFKLEKMITSICRSSKAFCWGTQLRLHLRECRVTTNEKIL